VRYRKMFGDSLVYVDDKPMMLLCDNTVFVKILPCLDFLMVGAEKEVVRRGAHCKCGKCTSCLLLAQWSQTSLMRN
jgi:TfoX/Sxy family transcriptional regulator of competence genes